VAEKIPCEISRKLHYIDHDSSYIGLYSRKEQTNLALMATFLPDQEG
jgi:hypothetical protein